jgi:hypothetical protein
MKQESANSSGRKQKGMKSQQTSARRKRLLDLPPELWFHIVPHLTKTTKDGVLDRSAQRNIRLMCRDLNEKATPPVFNDVTLSYRLSTQWPPPCIPWILPDASTLPKDIHRNVHRVSLRIEPFPVEKWTTEIFARQISRVRLPHRPHHSRKKEYPSITQTQRQEHIIDWYSAQFKRICGQLEQDAKRVEFGMPPLVRPDIGPLAADLDASVKGFLDSFPNLRHVEPVRWRPSILRKGKLRYRQELDDYGPLLGTSYSYAAYLLLKYMPKTVESFKFHTEPTAQDGACDDHMVPNALTSADLRNNCSLLVARTENVGDGDSQSQLKKLDLKTMEHTWYGPYKTTDGLFNFDLRNPWNLTKLLPRFSGLTFLSLENEGDEPFFGPRGYRNMNDLVKEGPRLPKLETLHLTNYSINAELLVNGGFWRTFPNVKKLFLDGVVLAGVLREGADWKVAMRAFLTGRMGKVKVGIQEPCIFGPRKTEVGWQCVVFELGRREVQELRGLLWRRGCL